MTHINFYKGFLEHPSIMKYAFREIYKYSPHSHEEIAGEMGESSKKMVLFENRIKNIINAILTL